MMFWTNGEIAAQHLTGRVRVRVGWFGRVIMQVEVKAPNPSYPRPPTNQEYDPWQYGSFTFWRDATATDIADLYSERSPLLQPEPRIDEQAPPPPPDWCGHKGGVARSASRPLPTPPPGF